jgi:hypothetical protein
MVVNLSVVVCYLLFNQASILKDEKGARILANAHYSNLFGLQESVRFNWNVRLGKRFALATTEHIINRDVEGINNCSMILDRKSGGIVRFSKGTLRKEFDSLENPNTKSGSKRKI